MNEINLYGTGENAARFILTHKDIKISRIIEGKIAGNAEIPDFLGYKVFYLPDVVSEMRRTYTVIASSYKAYWEIKRRLEKEYHLVEYENFEFFATFQKKRVFIYGNCHTQAIRWALQTSSEFNEKYGIYPLPEIQEFDKSYNCGKLWDGIDDFSFDKCDLFVHQCIQKDNTYGYVYSSNNIISKLNNECKVVGIPNLYRMPKFLYPQIPDEFEQIYYEPFGDTCYFIFRDKYIDANHEVPMDDLYKMVFDPSLIDKSEIIDRRDEFFSKLEQRDKEWDIHIYHFLENRIISEQCFYEPNHPTNVVLHYIAKKLLLILGIREEINLSSMPRLSANEIPIYKSVQQALGLEYYPSIIRCDGIHKLFPGEMNIREYIRQYLLWNFSNYPHTTKRIQYYRKKRE